MILSACGVTMDSSRQQITEETMRLLQNLAAARHVKDWRARMFSGELINTSENRPVLHTALRAPLTPPLLVEGRDIRPDIHQTLGHMEQFCHQIHTKSWRGHTGKPFDTIVNIGIGGSDLGPRMAVQALRQFQRPGIATHFVSNVDGHDLWRVLQSCTPETTLFVVASKTFSTTETLRNAMTARAWLAKHMKSDAAVSRHMVAASANTRAAIEFGINRDHIFTFGDWVGGRFSIWSSVGLSLALSIGFKGFRSFLDGAHAMDQHFANTPDEHNLPLILGMTDLWNSSICGRRSVAVLPYDQRLSGYPAWFQQLAMESNGKRVDRDGQPMEAPSSPVAFGTVGTDCQHSYMQMIHQGTDTVPCDFIGVLQHDHPWPEHHRMLLANMVAQADVLVTGYDAPDPQHSLPGNRPSNIILLDRVDPWHLGALMAMMEHRVFVQGILLGINSFDQFGVEVGKRVANQTLAILEGKGENRADGLLGLIAERLKT